MRGEAWDAARAEQRGVAPQALWRSGRFTRVTRGWYVASCDSDDVLARCRAATGAVPHAALSHWTALRLRGVPVPWREVDRLHVVVPAGATEPRRRDLVPHVVDVPRATVTVGGVRAVGVVDAWLDCAALRRAGTPDGLADLVAAGDAMLRDGLCTARQLHEGLRLRRRRRGYRVACRAAALLDARSESPMESRLRVVVVLAGLPPPVPQLVVRSPSGAFLGRVDLGWEDARLVVEYDGSHHREQGQWERDVLRREALEAAGWTVVVVTASQMRDPTRVVARIRARLGTHRAVS